MLSKLTKRTTTEVEPNNIIQYKTIQYEISNKKISLKL